jgi:hypothetical protein
MWLKRRIAKGEQVQIKKKKGKHGDILLIHYSEIEHVKPQEIDENTFEFVNGEQEALKTIVIEERSINGEPLTEVLDDLHDPGPYSEHVKDLAMEFIEYYDKKRENWDNERDKLVQGMMMYRYKFEELDKQVKALPAPPELLTSKIQTLEEEKVQALAQAQEIIDQAKEEQKRYAEAMSQLKAKLLEEEYAKEAFRLQWEQAMEEAKRPWWKKIMGMK